MTDMTDMTNGLGDPIDSWGALLLDDAGLDDAQAMALEVARSILPGDPGVSLTIRPLDGRGPQTRAATSTRVRELDEWQYEHEEGPCVTADETLAVCAISDLAGDDTFPAFADVALQAGVRGVASFPLLVRGDQSVGSLNVFYDEPEAVVAEAIDRGVQLASTLAPMLANFLTHQRAVELSRQLEEALAGRSIIERAKGLLMERAGIDADRAFELLSTQSQHENRKVREIAAEMLEQHDRILRGE